MLMRWLLANTDRLHAIEVITYLDLWELEVVDGVQDLDVSDIRAHTPLTESWSTSNIFTVLHVH